MVNVAQEMGIVCTEPHIQNQQLPSEISLSSIRYPAKEQKLSSSYRRHGPECWELLVMPLLSLPNELLLQIAENLNAAHTYTFLRTNRRICSLLAPLLLNFALREDRHCVTALYLAATNRNVKMIRLLLEKGTNIRITDRDEIRRGVTTDNVDKLLKLLLEQGPHSIIQDRSRGGTALHWAADYGHESMARLLLERGMTITAEDPFGRTALQWAAAEGQNRVVKLLLESGVDVNGKDYDYVTALHRAVEYGCDDVVQLLLEKGANIDAQDIERATPLHWATATDNLATARLLMETGADYTIRNRRGLMALDSVTDETLLAMSKLHTSELDTVD